LVDFEVREAAGLVGGMTVQIAEGARSTSAAAPNIVIHDHAFSLIEPILKRHLPDYHPMTRWGVRDAPISDWRKVVPDLGTLAAKLEQSAPSDVEVAWVHSFDLDRNEETDTSCLLAEFQDPLVRRAAAAMLVMVADWMEARLGRLTALTIFGY
jgi:hypothetical protein